MSTLAQRILLCHMRGSPSPYPLVRQWCARLSPSHRALSPHEPQELLGELCALKQQDMISEGVSLPLGVDYCRALCFLQDGVTSSAMAARQALLEEVRRFPEHEAAQQLLSQLQFHLRPYLLPPHSTRAAVLPPHFTLLFSSLVDYTMLSWRRLWQLYRSVEEIYRVEWRHAESYPEEDDEKAVSYSRPSVVECGTAGGGSAVLLAVTVNLMELKLAEAFPLRRHQQRLVYALDTFHGMPRPSSEDVMKDGSCPAEDTAWGSGTCAASLSSVKALAERFGVADRIVFLPGMFEETIPQSLIPQLDCNPIALLHLDADWYSSTHYVLSSLEHHLRRGRAIVQVDDYEYWDGCTTAVDEMCAKWREKQQPVSLKKIHGEHAVYFRMQ